VIGFPQTSLFGTMICTLSGVASSVVNSVSAFTVPATPPAST